MMKDSETPLVASSEDGRAVISRAVRVLRSLEQAPGGLNVAQLTRDCALPRTTVQRLVVALEAEKLLVIRGGKVSLGPALASLAAAAHREVRARLRPQLEALARETGETVDVWVLRDDAVVLIDEVSTQQEVRVVLSLGTVFALPCTAPGKLFLAAWTQEAMTALLRRAGTARPLPAVLAELEQVRRDGIAYDLEEHAEDVCALACLLDLGGAERYAIAIPAPARRFHAHRARLEAALRQCVRALEQGG